MVLSGQTNVTLGSGEVYLYVLPYDTTKQSVITDFVGRKISAEPDKTFTASFYKNLTGVVAPERARIGTTWDPSFVYRTSMKLVSGKDALIVKNVVAEDTALERNAPFVYSMDCAFIGANNQAFDGEGNPCEFTIVNEYDYNYTIPLNASWVQSGITRLFAIFPHETTLGKKYTYPYTGYTSLPYVTRDDASHVFYKYNGFRLDPQESLNQDGVLFNSFWTFLSKT